MTYDTFSADYDRFVNWPGRLAFEMPFIEQQLRILETSGRSVRVLDAACGTGMHAIELARRGYKTWGADLSVGMVDRARFNAEDTSTRVEFQVAGFGGLSAAFAPDPGVGGFDALLCLGNSLPHVLSRPALKEALEDFAACLRPGGLLLLQNRNFDLILDKRDRWMEPQSYREGPEEWLYVRFYDFTPEGTILFHILTLHRSGEAAWQQKITSTILLPLRERELSMDLFAAGFAGVTLYGDLAGSEFDAATSSNLVVVARKGAEG